MNERAIFIEALQIEDPNERDAFLQKVWTKDPDLRPRVERLLAAHFKAGSFLKGPATALTVFAQINSLCEQFRREWESTSRPAIRDFLEQIAENDRPTLLRNLLQIEIEQRLALGEQPNA